VAAEVDRARSALEAGRKDEALVHLWNAIEPARLAEDEQALREIAILAQALPERDAADLVAATGLDPADAPVSQPAPRSKKPARSRVGLVWLVLVALVAIANAIANVATDNAGSTRPAERPPGAEVANGGLHLVPLAGYPAGELSGLVATVTPYAGLVYVRNSIPLPPATYDPARKQFVAEMLLSRLRQSFAIAGPHTLVIGVTSFDMYERRQMTELRSSVARSDDGVFVVISTYEFGELYELREAALGRAIVKEIRRAPIMSTA